MAGVAAGTSRETGITRCVGLQSALWTKPTKPLCAVVLWVTPGARPNRAGTALDVHPAVDTRRRRRHEERRKVLTRLRTTSRPRIGGRATSRKRRAGNDEQKTMTATVDFFTRNNATGADATHTHEGERRTTVGALTAANDGTEQRHGAERHGDNDERPSTTMTSTPPTTAETITATAEHQNTGRTDGDQERGTKQQQANSRRDDAIRENKTISQRSRRYFLVCMCVCVCVCMYLR